MPVEVQVRSTIKEGMTLATALTTCPPPPAVTTVAGVGTDTNADSWRRAVAASPSNGTR